MLTDEVSCGSEGVSWASLGQAGLTPSSGSGSSLLHKSSFQNPGRRSNYHLQQDLFTAQTRAPRRLMGACQASWGPSSELHTITFAHIPLTESYGQTQIQKRKNTLPARNPQEEPGRRKNYEQIIQFSVPGFGELNLALLSHTKSHISLMFEEVSPPILFIPQ